MNKDINYYLNLPWTYSIERENGFYIIRVNELPGICTDSERIDEGMRNIKEVIAMAIEVYKEKGESIPEPV